jgi:hypothetical protein
VLSLDVDHEASIGLQTVQSLKLDRHGGQINGAVVPLCLAMIITIACGVAALHRKKTPKDPKSVRTLVAGIESLAIVLGFASGFAMAGGFYRFVPPQLTLLRDDPAIGMVRGCNRIIFTLHRLECQSLCADFGSAGWDRPCTLL